MHACMNKIQIPKPKCHPYAPLNRSIRTDVLAAKEQCMYRKKTISTCPDSPEFKLAEGVPLVLRRVVRIRYFCLARFVSITVSLLPGLLYPKGKSATNSTTEHGGFDSTVHMSGSALEFGFATRRGWRTRLAAGWFRWSSRVDKSIAGDDGWTPVPASRSDELDAADQSTAGCIRCEKGTALGIGRRDDLALGGRKVDGGGGKES
jgi:hypothetical protein